MFHILLAYFSPQALKIAMGTWKNAGGLFESAPCGHGCEGSRGRRASVDPRARPGPPHASPAGLCIRRSAPRPSRPRGRQSGGCIRRSAYGIPSPQKLWQSEAEPQFLRRWNASA
jgi:hypothetical protein